MIKDISVLILTRNEEIHIERCIRSVQSFAKEIYVVDSYSTDATVELSERLGAKILQNPWKNYAQQYQWGLDNCNISTEWVMRLDADEYVSGSLASEITQKNRWLGDDVVGMYVKRRVIFMGRWIRFGGYYPTWLLRIWRYKKGCIEERWMDEHIKLKSGKTVKLNNDIVDDNLNNLTWWTEKHNNYATREAIDLALMLDGNGSGNEIRPNLFGEQEQRRRWFKFRYAMLPLFLRPILYFCWRYVFRLGFLDGKQGLVWHILQGFWYRFLVDAKLYDIFSTSRLTGLNVKAIIRDRYNVKVGNK